MLQGTWEVCPSLARSSFPVSVSSRISRRTTTAMLQGTWEVCPSLARSSFPVSVSSRISRRTTTAMLQGTWEVYPSNFFARDELKGGVGYSKLRELNEELSADFSLNSFADFASVSVIIGNGSSSSERFMSDADDTSAVPESESVSTKVYTTTSAALTLSSAAPVFVPCWRGEEELGKN